MSSKFKENIRGFLFILQNFTVEPIIFLVYFGWTFAVSFQAPAIYKRICETTYGTNEHGVDCNNIRNESVEITVQENAAEWTIYTIMAYILPAIFANVILGAYADRKGRKTVILWGLIGITIVELGFLLTLSSVATPYWSTIIFCVFGGLTGFISMIPVSCNAYLADTTDDPSILTIKTGIFCLCQLVASCLGAFLSAALSGVFSVSVAIEVELGIFVLAFLFTAWRIPQKPGLKEIDRKTRVDAVRPLEVGSKKEKRTPQIIMDAVCFIAELLVSGSKSYFKAREEHNRLFLWITTGSLLINMTSSFETSTGGLISLFVFRWVSPNSLGWGVQDLGLWNGSYFAFLIVGTILGLAIFKRFLKFRETTIILIGIASAFARTIFIASSFSHDSLMYIGNAVGMFSILVQPAAISFIVQLVPSSEIGKIFAVYGIGADLAYLISTLLFVSIYRSSVDWFAGFVFYIIAGAQAFSFFAMFWVHFQSRNEISKEPKIDPKMTNVQSAISRIGEISTIDIERKPKSQPKLGKRQISIIQHAEALSERKDSALWESCEDLSRQTSRVNFY